MGNNASNRDYVNYGLSAAGANFDKPTHIADSHTTRRYVNIGMLQGSTFVTGINGEPPGALMELRHHHK